MAKTGWVWDGTQFVALTAPVGAFPNAVGSYGSVAPSNPTTGQIWNDAVNNQLKIWSGTNWIAYAPVNNTTLTGTTVIPSLSASVTSASVISASVVGGLVSSGLTTLAEIAEVLNTGTVSANVFTADANGGNVFYVTSAPSANFTINITNLPTTDNRVFSFSFFVIQGATGYIPNALQIGGASQTIKWSGGVAPTPTSGTGKIDVFNFTLIRRSAAWEALGDVSKNY